MELISQKIGIPTHRVKFFKDIDHKKPYKYTEASSLKKAGIINGSQVFVPAKNAKMKDIINVPQSSPQEEEEKIDTTTHGNEENKELPDGLTKQCTHGEKTK